MSDVEYYLSRALFVVAIPLLVALVSHLVASHLHNPEAAQNVRAVTFACTQAAIVLGLTAIIGGVITLLVF